MDLLRIFLSRAPYIKYLLLVVNMRVECFWYTTLRTELAVALTAYFDANRIAAPLAGHPESVASRQCTDYPQHLSWERQVANSCHAWRACYTRLRIPLPKVTRSGFETQIPHIDRCRLGALARVKKVSFSTICILYPYDSIVASHSFFGASITGTHHYSTATG